MTAQALPHDDFFRRAGSHRCPVTACPANAYSTVYRGADFSDALASGCCPHLPEGRTFVAMVSARPASLDESMARLAEGDRAAFTAVFEQLWPPTLRLCTSLLHHEADAADAAQQALEKILVRAADYDPTRPALPWALAIASWECRTLLKKRARRKEVSQDAAPNELFTHDDDYARRELERAALEVMGTLSDADREVLLATFWEEAASVGGATLRKRRERALTRLRDAFRRLYGID